MKNLIAVSLVLFLLGCATGTCRGVIGASYDMSNGIVDYSIKGSPAEKGGLKTGDTLTDREGLRGDPGKQVCVKYTRDGVSHEFNTTLVCIDDLKDDKKW